MHVSFQQAKYVLGNNSSSESALRRLCTLSMLISYDEDALVCICAWRRNARAGTNSAFVAVQDSESVSATPISGV